MVQVPRILHDMRRALQLDRARVRSRIQRTEPKCEIEPQVFLRRTSTQTLKTAYSSRSTAPVPSTASRSLFPNCHWATAANRKKSSRRQGPSSTGERDREARSSPILVARRLRAKNGPRPIGLRRDPLPSKKNPRSPPFLDKRRGTRPIIRRRPCRPRSAIKWKNRSARSRSFPFYEAGHLRPRLFLVGARVDAMKNRLHLLPIWEAIRWPRRSRWWKRRPWLPRPR